MKAFAAYVIGDLFDYLGRYPQCEVVSLVKYSLRQDNSNLKLQVCRRYSMDAQSFVATSLHILDLLTGWALARRWADGM